MRRMRATTIHAPADIRVTEVPDPVIERPTDAIVRVTAGCICGSDLWPYRGENDITPGQTIGHECIGVVEEVDDPRRFGIVMLDGGRVTRLIEKPQEPKSNLAIMGVYYVREVRQLFQAIDRQMSEEIQTKGEYYLADAVQLMIDDGAIFTTLPATVWEDCGTPDALLQTNRFLLSRSHTCTSAPDAVVVPPVFIAESAQVSGSVIGPNVSIGDNVVVENAIVRASIVDAGATIDSAMLTRSIIGRAAIVRGEPLRVNVGDSSDIDLRSNRENGPGRD